MTERPVTITLKNVVLLKSMVENSGKSLDPYVKVGIGRKHQWQSKIIKKGSLNNDFKNEQQKFMLTKQDPTKIILQFYDKKSLSADKLMGSASYDLKTHKQDSFTPRLKLMTEKGKQLGTVDVNIFYKVSVPVKPEIPKLPPFVTPSNKVIEAQTGGKSTTSRILFPASPESLKDTTPRKELAEIGKSKIDEFTS